LAWHFCSKANTIKLEKIQERTLRFIYEDYNSTYEELLHIVKVPFLAFEQKCQDKGQKLKLDKIKE
jgi:hypothetical protein